MNAAGVTLIATSRAPLAEIEAYRRRIGRGFPWASSFGSDFNRDYHASFTKAELDAGKASYNFTEIDAGGRVFRTCSSCARGPEELIGAFMILDRAPRGRNETTTMDWTRRHDEHEAQNPIHDGCA